MSSPTRGRRVIAAVLAFAVAMSGVGVAVWAFTSSRSTPAAPSPSLELSPHEVTTFSVGPNGQTNAILAAQGSVWVTAYGVEGGGGVDRDALFRIDPATNGVIATIPLETAPTNEVGGGGLTYANGSIWVTGGGRLQGEEPEALLQRVNPVTNEVVATIPLGGQFGSDVTGGAGAVWVAIFGDRSAEVVRVDPATNQVVDTTSLQSDYVRTVVTGDGGVLVEERVWEANEGPCPVLTAIDPTTNAIVARQPTDDPCASTSSAAYRLIPWEGGIWGEFRGPAGDSFGPLDPHTALPAGDGFPFEPDHFPRGFLVPDETGFWYGAYPGGNGNRPDRLARMDPSTGAITDYMELHGGIAAAVLDGSLWTLNYEGTVTRIDLFAEGTTSPSPNDTGTPVPTLSPTTTPRGSTIMESSSDVIPIEESPGAVSSVAYGFDSTWVASYDASEQGWLTRLDARTGETLACISTADVFPTWEVGGGGLAAGFGSMWMSGASSAKGEPSGVHAYLLRIDPTTDEVTATIDLHASSPADVAIDDTGVWVMSFRLGEQPTMEVSLIDPASNQVAATSPLESGYGHHLFSVDGWIVASTNAGAPQDHGATPGGVLNVLDPTSKAEVRTIHVGASASPAAGDDQLWLATGDTLERIDPSTGQMLEQHRVANTGDALAVGKGGIWFIDPEGRNTIERFNPDTGEVDLMARLPAETTPIAMATSPGAVWVLNYQGSITRVDLT